MDYLKDDELEKIGLIKEIDTLNIVQESYEIKEKRNKKILIVCFTLMMITALAGQILFISIFGMVRMMKIAIGVYLFVSVLIALILIDKGEKNLC